MARFIINAEVPAEWLNHFKRPDPNDPIQARDLLVVNAVVEAGRTGQSVRARASIRFDAGSRLLAKLASRFATSFLDQIFSKRPMRQSCDRGFGSVT